MPRATRGPKREEPYARHSKIYSATDMGTHVSARKPIVVRTWPPPLKAACSPQQGLPAKADKPIVVRAGLPFQNSGAVPPPEAEPSRVTGATSGGATLLGAIPRPDTRLTTRPTQTASLPGLVPYSPKERVPLPGDKPPIGKGGRPG
jgi:hypothetical protein